MPRREQSQRVSWEAVGAAVSEASITTTSNVKELAARKIICAIKHFKPTIPASRRKVLPEEIDVRVQASSAASRS